ncbi:MAG: TIGR02444 family protein [Pseudomonas sp.]|uniref:TIGR02444 family protein n=1 Tax=Pseudomonas sp. TaxID=306 RepID=UPI0027200D8C|nr:TIGR02444 family protein [Pseudomonas sp.]MDO9616356.1 TIGR02444 family protein [Pseudomonas sp.]MDP2445748.1 TIGR02444 family protein [Pseudomonas sp.]MDZ4332940.1 TIGR02444 family protein [Pseudomonas sp.]
MPTDLWRFAEALYQRPGVEVACLLLQTQDEDVCLLLCAAWLERRQIAYCDERAEALRALAQPWQQQVVMPLRQLRQNWREQAQSDNALKQLREQIKQLELEAEREQLERLAACTQDWSDSAADAPLDWLERLTPQPGNRDALQTLRIAAAQLSA